MSLENAIKIVTIIDGDRISKVAQTSFGSNLNVIKNYTKTTTLEKIAKKANELVVWITDEIIKAKANDIHENMSEEEINFVLDNISNPTIAKAISIISKQSDSYNLKLNALEVELVTKFIDLIKEEDKVLGKNIQEGLREYSYLKSNSKSILN